MGIDVARRRWVVAFALGEALGFGLLAAAALVLAAWITRDMEPGAGALTRYLIAIVGGAIEGWVLARFQWSVLSELVPGRARWPWLRNTALAAALAWAAGMLAPTLDDLVGLGAPVQAVLWVGAGLVILPSIGVAQTLALRSVGVRAPHWVRANVLGWLAGLPWTFVLPALLPDEAPPAAFAATFLVSGTLMGACAGLVTSRHLPHADA